MEGFEQRSDRSDSRCAKTSLRTLRGRRQSGGPAGARVVAGEVGQCHHS